MVTLLIMYLGVVIPATDIQREFDGVKVNPAAGYLEKRAGFNLPTKAYTTEWW